MSVQQGRRTCMINKAGRMQNMAVGGKLARKKEGKKI